MNKGEGFYRWLDRYWALMDLAQSGGYKTPSEQITMTVVREATKQPQLQRKAEKILRKLMIDAKHPDWNLDTVIPLFTELMRFTTFRPENQVAVIPFAGAAAADPQGQKSKKPGKDKNQKKFICC